MPKNQEIGMLDPDLIEMNKGFLYARNKYISEQFNVIWLCLQPFRCCYMEKPDP